MRPLYLFDIDGTIADMSHRLYLIQNEEKDWNKFFDYCKWDRPIHSNLLTLKLLHNAGCDIHFLTGRNAIAKDDTIDWLAKHTPFNPLQVGRRLSMRAENDRRPDHIIKEHWYNNLSLADQSRLIAVFEDRSSVVDMWRKLGITCYQVTEGDF